MTLLKLGKISVFAWPIITVIIDVSKILNCIGVRVMVFNATFNNISVISWRSVLLVEETGVPWENHRPAVNHW
jgi:hypothetical protein